MQHKIITSSIVLTSLLLAGCGTNETSPSATSLSQNSAITDTKQYDETTTIKTTKNVVEEGESVLFTADNSNELSDYVWEDENGNILGTQEKLNRLFTKTGNYKTTLSVYHDNGSKSTVFVRTQVKKCSKKTVVENKAPIAKITTDSKNIISGNCVYLHGDNSIDSDGHITKYAWRDSHGVLLGSESTLAHGYRYKEADDINKDGTNYHDITLYVTDDAGETAKTTVTIVVERGYKVPAEGSTKPLEKLNFPLGSVTFDNGFKLEATWGLGSGATHKAGDDADTFYTLTDRGVNVKCKDDQDITGMDICEKGKIFPFPSFSPSIIKYQLDDTNAVIKKVITLKDRCGFAISGVSNPLSNFSEIAYDIHGNEMDYDPNGLDTESITALSDGTFWLSDEYAPSLVHVAADGKIIKRLVPKGLEKELCGANYCVVGALPEILKMRHANRGIESVAVSQDEKTLYFAMQSPLDNPSYSKSRNVRLFAMNIENPSDIKSYLYKIDLPDSFNKDNESKTRTQKDVKVSEISVMDDGSLMILERISKTTKLYHVDLSKETPLDPSYLDISQTPTLEEEKDIKGVEKTKLFDTDLESGYPSKLEGIADLGDNHYLLINDNDFGIEGADTTAKIATIDPEKKPYKKHIAGRVVFFDTDGKFEKEVKVGILPDMLTFTHDGKKVLVANEGEPAGAEELADVVYDPYGSITIIDTKSYKTKEIDFKSITTAPAGSKIKKGAEIARDFEPEYIAVSQNDKIAWVTLQESNAVAKLDLEKDTLSSVFGLGFKDLSKEENALDYKKDEILNIETTPVGVYGMYQPDTIASYEVSGVNYFVTANEGDDRDDFYEETTKASKLQHSGIPDIGDLRVNPDIGDEDGDGDYEKLYAYGGRSFSIWSEDGTQVFDSGNAFAKEVAARFPTQFNTRDKKGKWKGLDERSEKKGIEPEALTLKKIGSKTFAYIGLEKQGGFFVYDVTDPANPVQIDYNNDIDYSVNAKDSDVKTNIDDIAPEGMVAFTQDSNNYLAVANEGSGTVSLYLLEDSGKAIKQSTYYTGIYGKSAAEIVEYDADGKKLFVTNAAENEITILDAHVPTSLQKISSIDLKPYGTGVNSVSVSNGHIAVAIERKE